MKRKSVYPYTNTEPPGCNVHRLRNALGLSQRDLADKCNPPLDHTTVRRIEVNQGFNADSLGRIARALGVTIETLFLPPELADYAGLPESVKRRIRETLADAVAVHKKQKS